MAVRPTGPSSAPEIERPDDIGMLQRMLRFALAGGTVAGVYVLVTLLLSKVVGLPFQAALVVGFTTALATHFTLQRVFVWVHHEEFALSTRAQAGRYLAVSLTQYGVTAASTAVLPGALGVSTESVYVLVTACTTAINFTVFRTRVFHPESQSSRSQS